MRFAVSYSPPYHGVDPDLIVGYAQHAEVCGFEGIYLPEHIVLYPGATIGQVELPPTLSYLDPLDCLSRRADEAIDVLRLLWAGGEEGVSFSGEFFAFERLSSFPKPYRSRSLPIHVGGSSRAAARRAGHRGDGYLPGGFVHPDERAAQLALARRAAAEAGRDPDAWEYTRTGSMEMTAERVERLAAEGVNRIVVGCSTTDPHEQRDEMSAFAERFGLEPRGIAPAERPDMPPVG